MNSISIAVLILVIVICIIMAIIIGLKIHAIGYHLGAIDGYRFAKKPTDPCLREVVKELEYHITNEDADEWANSKHDRGTCVSLRG